MSEIRVTEVTVSPFLPENFIYDYAKDLMYRAVADGMRNFKGHVALVVSLPQRCDRHLPTKFPGSETTKRIQVSVAPIYQTHNKTLTRYTTPDSDYILKEVWAFYRKHNKMPNVYFVPRPTAEGEKIELNGFYIPEIEHPIISSDPIKEEPIILNRIKRIKLRILTGTMEGPALI